MIKITCNFSREKNNDRKILIKHVLQKNHLILANFEHGQEELPTSGKHFPEAVIYAAANTFFQLTLVFTADGHNGFCFDSFFE